MATDRPQGLGLGMLDDVARSDVARIALGAVAVTVIVLAIYYLVPLDARPHGGILARLIVGFAIFGVVLANELRSIVRHDHPMVRAGAAMLIILPLFVVLFAWIYLTMSHSNPLSFTTRPLDRTEALYFTMTVLSTVGFGDIVPRTDPARILVIIQMVADLVLLAVVVRLIFGVASQSRSRGPGGGAEPTAVTGD